MSFQPKEMASVLKQMRETEAGWMERSHSNIDCLHLKKGCVHWLSYNWKKWCCAQLVVLSLSHVTLQVHLVHWKVTFQNLTDLTKKKGLFFICHWRNLISSLFNENQMAGRVAMKGRRGFGCLQRGDWLHWEPLKTNMYKVVLSLPSRSSNYWNGLKTFPACTLQ